MMLFCVCMLPHFPCLSAALDLSVREVMCFGCGDLVYHDVLERMRSVGAGLPKLKCCAVAEDDEEEEDAEGSGGGKRGQISLSISLYVWADFLS